MGFTTALISSFTLTTSCLYLTLLYHQRARAHQAAILHQSSLILTSLADPDVASDLATMADENYSGGLREGVKDYKLQRAGLVERWKDGWNREVEGAVRWCNGVGWRGVREGLEGRWEDWERGRRRT